MGEIKAAIFTTHVPRLMITDLAARKAYMGKNVTTFYDAMPQLERERLHALDITTLEERAGSPVILGGSVACDPHAGGSACHRDKFPAGNTAPRLQGGGRD